MSATAAELFKLVRKGVDTRAVHAHVRKPFRFLLCGDPALVADLRAFLLSGHPNGDVPPDAAACIETLRPDARAGTDLTDARAVVYLARGGELRDEQIASLRHLRLPILAVEVDPHAAVDGPQSAPAAGTWERYRVPTLTRDDLRARVFPHLVESARGVEIAVGRRLPPLRETVAAVLTRHAARNALNVAVASALVDHVPLLGLALGAVASAGDMVAITGIQIVLLMQIQATYGIDPDLRRLWQLLPVIGGGYGWRTLARELVGFAPVIGVPIKGAIAYAGTIVVGEGAMFFFEHGRLLTAQQAREIYERTKDDALRFVKELVSRRAR